MERLLDDKAEPSVRVGRKAAGLGGDGRAAEVSRERLGTFGLSHCEVRQTKRKAVVQVTLHAMQ